MIKETDNDIFNNKAYELQGFVCNEFVDLGDTQNLLKEIKEGMKEVRVGSNENKAVGQGKVTCCTHVSLMFIHLIRCKNATFDMGRCGHEDLCRLLGPQLQTLINYGKACHPTIMNTLTYNDPKKDHDFPELGELFTLLNGVMPNPLLISERGSDVYIEEDCSGLLCSNVEEGSADLNQTHINWTDIGQLIRMLHELMNDGQSRH